MSDDSKPTASSSLSSLEKLVGIAITALAAWSAYQSTSISDVVKQQNQDLEALKVSIARNADERETRKLNKDITFQVFGEVKEIFRTPDADPALTLNRLRAVSAMVEFIPETDVRRGMGRAIQSAMDNVLNGVKKPSEALQYETARAKAAVDLSIFRAEQSDSGSVVPKDLKSLKVAVAESKIESPKWSNYDFDFFWCEKGDPESARRVAELAASLKDLDPSASGRWRVRKLPAEINEKPGYRVADYKIHVTSDDEEKLAKVLRGTLKQRGIPSDKLEFVIHRINFATPWYISVFACPGGAPKN